LLYTTRCEKLCSLHPSSAPQESEEGGKAIRTHSAKASPNTAESMLHGSKELLSELPNMDLRRVFCYVTIAWIVTASVTIRHLVQLSGKPS
jgi:hypothetical protein